MSEIPTPERQGAGRWRQVFSWLKRLWADLPPHPAVRKGAGWGAALLVALLAGVAGASMRLGLGSPVLDWAAGVLLGLGAALLIGLAAALVFRILEHSRLFFGWMGLGSLGVLAFFLSDLNLPVTLALLVLASLIAANAALGGAVVMIRSGLWRRAGRPRQIVWLLALVLAAGLDLHFIWWFARPGSSDHLRTFRAEALQALQSRPLEACDPAQAGEYPVLTLTYGSGTDYRPEFGPDVSLTTKPVDASPFVKGNEGWRMKVRHWHFGFDFKEFPVNGRVWYPDGDGPFPLVLIVHGNHNLVERSDPGYAYLGEHLASRGFILASVDENFFNGFWLAGLRRENDARGWMLLQHLKVWRDWSRRQGNPFYQKVDMSRIGLIGHSRGGEAAAIAGAFNRLSHYPDDATVEFDFDFDIRAIIAIAPSDGQYLPSDRPTPLKNVNYLVLQGGHDADVSVFVGARQWQRVEFDDGRYWFKASIFSYRSNHGQFNTVWGNTDFSWPRSLALNLEPLLKGEAQRRVGKVYMTAFLEATLRDGVEYLTLFRDHRTAARWLPRDYYISRFQDSTYRAVCDFEEDIDVLSASVAGSRIESSGLATWREEELDLRRRGSKQNKVVFLGWRSGRDPAPEEQESSYAVHLRRGLAAEWGLGSDSLLVFALADADEKPGEREEEGDEEHDAEEAEDEEEDSDKEPLDLSVELESSSGSRARIVLSQFRLLTPPLESRFTKFKDESDFYGKKWEPTLQTFEIPLGAFLEASPDLDVSQLETIRLVFDQSEEGVIILDDVGFAKNSAGGR